MRLRLSTSGSAEDGPERPLHLHTNSARPPARPVAGPSPFSPSLRVANGAQLWIDWRRHLVVCGDTRVALSRREIQLFSVLFEHPGQTLSPPELASMAWDRSDDPGSMISLYMSTLRRKLAWFGDRFGVRTIRGQGYRFEVSR